jgi:XTP/dITP diphosphohydrolase
VIAGTTVRDRIILATQNQKKAKELAELAAGRARVATLVDVGLRDLDVKEDGDTFAENAEKKARGALDALLVAKHPLDDVRAIVADDSGLVVDALGGDPGVRSARYALDANEGKGDDANNALLLRRLAGVPDARRTARFVCHIAAVLLPDLRLVTVDGRVEGRVGHALTGAGGFGYDPLFLPNEAPGKTMAELTADEKHAISHRGRAMRLALAALFPPA